MSTPITLLSNYSLTILRSASLNRSNTASPVNGMARRETRSRASSNAERFSRIDEDEPLEPPRRPMIGSRVSSGANSPRKELPGFDLPARPNGLRSSSTPGFEGPMSLTRGETNSPAPTQRLARVPTEPSSILGARSNLRITKPRESSQPPTSHDVFGDDQSDYSRDSADPHRTTSLSTAAQDGSASNAGKKAPPPPPPSRAKKPPPPPPMKRSALSTSEVPGY